MRVACSPARPARTGEPVGQRRYSPAMPKDPAEFAARITNAYTTEGPAVVLGRGMLDGAVQPSAVVQVPAAMMNRHGLIAGATGTGKTKTLQLLAEQLSDLGVPVFAADVKGDLSGLARPGEPNEGVGKRV